MIPIRTTMQHTRLLHCVLHVRLSGRVLKVLIQSFHWGWSKSSTAATRGECSRHTGEKLCHEKQVDILLYSNKKNIS